MPGSYLGRTFVIFATEEYHDVSFRGFHDADQHSSTLYLKDLRCSLSLEQRPFEYDFHELPVLPVQMHVLHSAIKYTSSPYTQYVRYRSTTRPTCWKFQNLMVQIMFPNKKNNFIIFLCHEL